MPYRSDMDEGPTDEDVERFSGQGGYCPECGHSVYDDADICPACGAWITGEVSGTQPFQREVDHRSKIVLVVAILIGFAGTALWLF